MKEIKNVTVLGAGSMGALIGALAAEDKQKYQRKSPKMVFFIPHTTLYIPPEMLPSIKLIAVKHNQSPSQTANFTLYLFDNI